MEESQITVCVVDPIVKDAVKNYVVYTVKGTDKHSNFEQQRRYNDFVVYRNLLVANWPGCFIPSLPPKKMIGSMDAEFIELRRMLLESFLKEIAERFYLWHSEETQLFVRSQGADFEKSAAQLPKQSEQFKFLQGVEISAETAQRITMFQAFLNKVKPMMKNFKKMAKNIMDTRKSYTQEVYTVIQQVLPDYEKNCIFEYTGKQDKLLSDQQEQVEAVKQGLEKQDFNLFLISIQKEAREIKAFLECLSQRDKYEKQKTELVNKKKEYTLKHQELMAGKSSLKSVFSKGSKEEQANKLQFQIETTQKEIESVTYICEIMNAIISYVQIDHFKKTKKQLYIELLRKMSESEFQVQEGMSKYWQNMHEKLSY